MVNRNPEVAGHSDKFGEDFGVELLVNLELAAQGGGVDMLKKFVAVLAETFGAEFAVVGTIALETYHKYYYTAKSALVERFLERVDLFSVFDDFAFDWFVGRFSFVRSSFGIS